MPVRLPVATLVLAVGLTAGVVAVRVSSSPAPHVAAPARGTSQTADRQALAVLRSWDARRAAAWAVGDAEALAGLYAAGSPAGAADVALLSRYTRRGLVVRGLRMQVLRAQVLRSRPHALVLVVTDRVAAAVAVPAGDLGVARRLPADSASSRRLVLRRVAGGWVMVRVEAVAPAGSAR
jgi:hypothetical protein